MKLALIAFLTFSSFSIFASEKFCYGTSLVKGINFKLVVTEASATISEGESMDAKDLEGSFPSNGTFTGRNGKTYISYHMSSQEGSTDLVIEKAFLQEGVDGWAQIRWKGESYDQSSYYCKAKKQN